MYVRVLVGRYLMWVPLPGEYLVGTLSAPLFVTLYSVLFCNHGALLILDTRVKALLSFT